MPINKKIQVLVCVLAICAPLSSGANPLDFAVRHPMLSALGAGTSVYLLSDIHISRDLSYHTEKVGPYFDRHPEKFKPISKYVLGALAKPTNESGYDRYRRLAEEMGLDNIPPYVTPIDRNPVTLINPQYSGDPSDGVYENPFPIDDASNIIYTPEGEEFDTGTEFPNEQIATWEDYLFLKAESQKLADNMEAAGMGKRPKGYAAHHIVSWNNGKRFEDCQKE